MLREWNLEKQDWEEEQAKFINNLLCFTNDKWNSVQMALGKIDVNGVEMYGLLVDALVGKMMLSEKLYIVNDKNSIFLDENGAKFVDCTIKLNSDGFIIDLNPTDGIKINNHGKDVFYADSNGDLCISGTLEACNGSFTGTLQSCNGIFTGTLEGCDGIFSGLLKGGKVEASEFTGGKIYSKDFYIIDEVTGELKESGTGTMIDLDKGEYKFNGSSTYSWFMNKEANHLSTIDYSDGRIKLLDRSNSEFKGALYLSFEGISTTPDGNNASGVIDFMSHLFGTSAAGNEYNGISIITDGSPAALISKRGDIIVDPHMDDRSGGVNGNKFAFTVRESINNTAGDGVIYWGKRVYDESLKKFTYASGLQFSSNEQEQNNITVLDGTGNLGRINASNLPKAITDVKVNKDVDGRITKLNCTLDDGSNTIVSIKYNSSGNITQIGDTVLNY